MRILILSDLPPFVLGGAERQVLLLAQAWQSAGHRVQVLAHRTPSGVHAGIPARHIPHLRHAGRILRAVTFALGLALLLLRAQRRADLLYCRFFAEATWVCVVLKRLGLLRLPLVVTPAAAGEGRHADFARLRRLWGHRLLLRWARREVDAFNAISEGIAQALAEAGLPVSARIPNGVRIDDDPVPEPAASYWLFVGRLTPQKGVDVLLAALALLRGQGQRLTLRIVGEGPAETALRDQCARLRLTDQVHFLGRLPHADILGLLPQARALVLPSRYEGLSNAALEALAAGTPVIATPCGGIDRYLDENTGWVCAATPDALAAALAASAAESPARHQQRRHHCRALARTHFSITACADAHLLLFERLCRAAPGPARTGRCNDRPSHRG
ncbi:(1-_4)-alpha-D-glucan synthase (UDP-glucose) [Fontimonas thermophila]|uniref:(1->4)-alpha-D-glucan synthase (UDP-glucose) n=1 Tax=Fontimonas thermophila TaxID=1076937 RepID=A0A1I2K332_9GAMM|nr:glycosyltransferase [Fontimonas thermophila]SFF60779.1 (1->4)-alpha-D-glucan synthase (UDP-glucose) [Fontimonas thermophila]